MIRIIGKFQLLKYISLYIIKRVRRRRRRVKNRGGGGVEEAGGRIILRLSKAGLFCSLKAGLFEVPSRPNYSKSP